jgi:predicted Zn-dependent protease
MSTFCGLVIVDELYMTRVPAICASAALSSGRAVGAPPLLLLFVLLGACAVSQQREVEIGQDYSRQIDAQVQLVQDPEVNRYISVLGDSLARIADSRNLDWQFKIVNSAEVNAFALPGGFIYVNRGLIERAGNLSQVAGVLGHEIGHVTQRHSMQQMQKATGANVGLIGLCIVVPSACRNQASSLGIQLGAGALFAGFSRADESEADAVAVEYLVRAGIDPRGVPNMFRALLEERERRPAALEGWFATHPLEEARIRNTEALIAAYDSSVLRSLTSDSPRFQEFKRRVAALPPPR